jgi:FlaA1/EpsC-like NDP-sugar epimerase
MGEPIRIADLARTLIRLSGASEEGVPIVFTGLRPGEKLYEELFYSTETLFPTPHEKVQCTHGNLLPWPNLSGHLQELQRLLLSGSEESMRAKIRDIVPEYNNDTVAAPDDARPDGVPEPAMETLSLSRAFAPNN